ncbi:MAG: fibronectin type III domain-containing protein [Acidobacteria bacterium]|nr:fibronectin type III domain-containing protein [Acidobacteriota bacterium]
MIVSCAKIADPQPPNLTPPSTIHDLRLEQRENHIILDFSLPSTYVDGQPLELRSVAIYRLTLGRSDRPTSVTFGQMEQAAQVIEKLRLEDLEKWAKDGRYQIEDVAAFADPNLIFQRSFVYALRFFSAHKVASQFSNIAFIAPIAPAAAPVLRSIRVTEHAVLLEWSAPPENIDGSVPPRMIGYRVFRGDSISTLAKLDDIEGDERHYSDSAIVPEQIYYYAVQARSLEEPPAFGPVSQLVSVTTKDVFPPVIPTGVAAMFSGGHVELVWEPNSEIDLQGYNIYRSGAIEGTFQKVNSTPVVVNSFSDTPPNAGVFYYRISAVDLKGNESASSEAVSVDFQ